MTDEEVAEYNRLLDRYNYLVSQNNALAAELESGIDNCIIVGDNIDVIGDGVTKNVNYVADETIDAKDIVERLHALIVDVTEHYFLFKNLSEASKMLTKYNDEYYTKYKFYNELRRITLGYVIGIDSHIVSSESLRKKVEKSYLANTDYWLSYAIMAVMLWASDEKEAAYRALNKAMTMDCYKSCVFFMLVNIRFNRLDVAREWYLTLLDKTDVNNMSDEWQHVLRAYLVGAMSKDRQFTDLADGYFGKMIEQTEATNVDFNKKITEKARSFAENYIHLTEKEFITLKETCAEYKEMKSLLSSMEKIAVMAKHYDDIYQMEEDEADNLTEQIENILYDLINAYDEKEFEVVKTIKKNEFIMSANGDLNIANSKFVERYGEENQSKKTFGDLMIKWAFDEDYRETDIIVKRFSLSYLKDRISKGIVENFESDYATLKDKYTFTITSDSTVAPCRLICNENEYDSSADTVRKHYNKHKNGFIMSDKLFKVFLFMCIGAVALLAIAGLTVSTSVFPVLLTLGIVLGIVGGFLVWRRWVDLSKELAEKCRLALVKLRKSLDELASWKKLVVREYQAMDDLKNSIDKF